jgi:membrane protein
VSWSKAEGVRAAAWATGARSTHPSVDVGFRLADRDKRVAAGVLAGGVAYRLFFWFLSLSLLVNGTLGFADGHKSEQVLLDAGVDPVVASGIADLSQQSEQARWWLVIVGVWLLLWTGYLGAKALVLVHAAVWGVPATPVHKPLWASLGFTASVLAFAASMAVVQWVRAGSHFFGVVVTLASAAIPLAFWLVVSRRLPHRGSGWRVLLPGALVVALGVHAFYLFTVWFLGPKLANATDTYGLLGVVATMLFWLYLVGRLVIGGATLNAALYDHRSEGTPNAEVNETLADGVQPGDR